MHIQYATMHTFIFLLSALMTCGVLCGEITKLDDLTGTSIEKCINCICFAKTRSWDINLCGRRLMTLAHWRTAGSLTTSTDGRPEIAWKSCKEDKNCILNSIKRYTESFGELDCNSDGELNCEDRFRVQILRNRCVNGRIAPIFLNRFDICFQDVFKSEGERIISHHLLLELPLNVDTIKAKPAVAVDQQKA